MRKANLAESHNVLPGRRARKLVSSCIVRQGAHSLYEFCRDVRNLAKISPHPVHVTMVSPVEAHWESMSHAGRLFQWTTLLINDEPDRLLAWRSQDDALVPHAGSIRFDAIAGRNETVVTVKVDYDLPGGLFGNLVARLAQWDASHELDVMLQRLKEQAEEPAPVPVRNTGRVASAPRSAFIGR